MCRLFLLIVCLTVSCLSTVHAQLRINHIRVKGTHNSYHVRTPPSLPEWDMTLPSLTEQATSQQVRAFEIDINWDDGNLTVYHFKTYDQGSICATFSVCLTEISTWLTNQQNNQTFLFVQLETKGTFNATQWDRVDSVLLSTLTRARLITPADVRGSYPSLREAVLSGNGFPTLNNAKGRVLVFLDQQYPEYYQGANQNLFGRLAFPSFDVTTDPLSAVLKLNDPVLSQDKIVSAVGLNFIVRTRADTEVVNVTLPVTYDDLVNRVVARMDLSGDGLVNFDELWGFIVTLYSGPNGAPVPQSSVSLLYTLCVNGGAGLTAAQYKCVEQQAAANGGAAVTLKSRFAADGSYQGQTIANTTTTLTAALSSGAQIISTDFPGLLNGPYSLNIGNSSYGVTFNTTYLCNPKVTATQTCTEQGITQALAQPADKPADISSSSSSSSSSGSSSSSSTARSGAVARIHMHVSMLILSVVLCVSLSA